MEWTLEHVEQPELAGRAPEGGHREVVLEHDDVRRLFGIGLGWDSMELFTFVQIRPKEERGRPVLQ